MVVTRRVSMMAWAFMVSRRVEAVVTMVESSGSGVGKRERHPVLGGA
jgi:hypothetical protein